MVQQQIPLYKLVYVMKKNNFIVMEQFTKQLHCYQIIYIRYVNVMFNKHSVLKQDFSSHPRSRIYSIIAVIFIGLQPEPPDKNNFS